jgi:hypothetical protein
VGAFGVVVAEVALKVELEAGLLGDQIAGEGRLPALVQEVCWTRSTQPLVWGLPARM